MLLLGERRVGFSTLSVCGMVKDVLVDILFTYLELGIYTPLLYLTTCSL